MGAACCTSPRSWLTWSAMDTGNMSSGAEARRASWPARRLFPLLATVIMAAAGMAGTIWGPRFYGKTAWALPDDLWGTLIAAQRLAHLNLAGLYTYPTQLVSLPGAAIILVPAIAVIDPAGLTLTVPHAHVAYPSVWLFAGPYQVAISAVALFAADAIAERLGATRPKRFWLAAASATALWSVTVRWGHPEDAVAIGLFLYAILALADARPARSPWLAGAAVAVQPLVLLAFPLLAAVVEPRRLPGYVARAAAAGALALRSALEPVMVSYYLWRPLAVALAAAATDWSRLLPVGCTAVGLTFFSQVQWHNPWSWWTPMVAGLAVALFFARRRSRGT